jgi:hypothetical protein
MKRTSVLTIALLSTVLGASVAIPQGTLVSAELAPVQIIAKSETSQSKIAKITAVKGKPESAKLMREFYKEDLTPIGIQPGGAGMVVNLYSKKDDTTVSLCTTFDVVVAIKKGRITRFAPAEVK